MVHGVGRVRFNPSWDSTASKAHPGAGCPAERAFQPFLRFYGNSAAMGLAVGKENDTFQPFLGFYRSRL